MYESDTSSSPSEGSSGMNRPANDPFDRASNDFSKKLVDLVDKVSDLSLVIKDLQKSLDHNTVHPIDNLTITAPSIEDIGTNSSNLVSDDLADKNTELDPIPTASETMARLAAVESELADLRKTSQVKEERLAFLEAGVERRRITRRARKARRKLRKAEAKALLASARRNAGQIKTTTVDIPAADERSSRKEGSNVSTAGCITLDLTDGKHHFPESPICLNAEELDRRIEARAQQRVEVALAIVEANARKEAKEEMRKEKVEKARQKAEKKARAKKEAAQAQAEKARRKAENMRISQAQQAAAIARKAEQAKKDAEI